MATNPSPNPHVLQALQSKIEQSIKQAINNEFDRAIEDAVKEANSRRDEIVASTALQLSTWMQIEDRGQQLVITIVKPEKPDESN